MNRYPLWKYILVACALVIGFIYTLPNFFGESPAVQVSSARATLKVDLKTLERVESTLKTAGIESKGTFLDTNGVKVRLQDTDTQLKAKDHKALLDALAKGDEVVTQGGLAGRLTKVGDDFVTLAITDNVEIQMQKPAITLVLPKGTLKSQ